MASENRTEAVEPLSLVVTTLNNAATLGPLLDSVSCADEVVVLDSNSTDDTVAIARERGARVFIEAFRGYGPQKQRAIDLAQHDWVLLLDADEALEPEADAAIAQMKRDGFRADAYELPRIEQVFWRMQSRFTRPNHFLRLFDRQRTRMSDMPIHAAPKCDGTIARLPYPLVHYGEPDIETKVTKINRWSTELAAHKAAKGRRANPWIMVFYPPVYFLRLYIFKRQFANGWAGFVNSVTGAYYSFLKYAKLYELHRRRSSRSDED